MADSALTLQSIIFDDRSVQVSYYDEDQRNEAGMKIITLVVNPLEPGVKSELADLVDSAEQLIVAFERAYRDKSVPVPSPGR
jgi:hypothetical protein